MDAITIRTMHGEPATIDLRDQLDLSDDLEAIARRLADAYRAVREEVDTTGTLFARHELQRALIEVRRLRRTVVAIAEEMEAELDDLVPVATQGGRHHPGRPLRVVRST